jgi:hypothetical protein
MQTQRALIANQIKTEHESGGHLVPIKTVQGFRADGSRFKTRRGVSVRGGGFFQLPARDNDTVQLA